MSQCLFKMSHKDIKHNPEECTSSDGVQVYKDEEDGDITAYCFSCGTYIEDPLGGKTKKEVKQLTDRAKVTKSKEEVKEEMDFIATLGTRASKKRKLKEESLEYYGVKIGLSEYDGKTPAYAYFPYTRDGEIVKYKVKMLQTGKVWSVGFDNKVDLFGWEEAIQLGSKRIIITEGEFDAVALKQIIDTYNDDSYTPPAVVSIPNGAASAVRDLTRLLPKVRKHFQEIVLAFDQDEAGQKAVEGVCKIARDVQVAELPKKDANECLIKRFSKAAFNAVTFRFKTRKNSKLVWAEDIHEEAKVPAEWGYSWPWEHVNQATKGIRLGETIYVGAGQKQGKSEFADQLAEHLMQEHGWPVLMAKPEQANNKTLKKVYGKVMAKKFDDPEVEFDEEAYDKAGELLHHKLCMINLYQHLGYETLKDDIIEAAGEGVKAVFIDPITNLVNGMSAADQNTKLQEIAQDLGALALDLNIVIFIFCHLRNPDSGDPHELGGRVLSSQFAGSRAMARSCNLMFGIEGNRDPDISEIERCTKTLVLLEDREYGNAGRYQLFWDRNTTLFNEIKE